MMMMTMNYKDDKRPRSHDDDEEMTMMTFMIGHCEDSAASRFDATAMPREPEVRVTWPLMYIYGAFVPPPVRGRRFVLLESSSVTHSRRLVHFFDVHLVCVCCGMRRRLTVASLAALSATLGVAGCPCGLAVATW